MKGLTDLGSIKLETNSFFLCIDSNAICIELNPEDESILDIIVCCSFNSPKDFSKFFNGPNDFPTCFNEELIGSKSLL